MFMVDLCLMELLGFPNFDLFCLQFAVLRQVTALVDLDVTQLELYLEIHFLLGYLCGDLLRKLRRTPDPKLPSFCYRCLLFLRLGP